MIAARQIAFGRGAAKKEEPPAYGGLCFTAESANSSVQLTTVGSAPAVTLVKSFDGVNWENYAVGEVIDLPSVGDFVYLAAGEGGNNSFSASASAYHKFVINGLVASSGDITSILNFDCAQTALDKYCYVFMFEGCTGLTSAPVLPATTLAIGCYQCMFENCTGLTSAPELPATTLATGCYRYMFDGCTGLTSAPKLPATTLASGCYQNMFKNCTGLTSAPELPATTLADSCYAYMFMYCGLTSAPKLPATTLADSCYASMFAYCTGLTSAPELPATTLATDCYRYMFEKCTGLTSAPVLPATTLAPGCYQYMFEGCTNLSLIKVYFITWEGGSTTGWLNRVSPTGTFYKPTALPEEYGGNKIPTGWTVINEG